MKRGSWRWLLAALFIALGAVVTWRLTHGSPRGSAGPGPDAGLASGSAPGPRSVAPVRPARPLRLSSATADQEASASSGAFEGKVVSSGTGRGVGGASLTFAHAGVVTTVSSAADGRFVLDAAAPGAHALVLASADGYLPFAPPWGHSPVTFFARAGERVRGIEVWLTPAIPYVAAVQDESGRPVERASLRVLGDDGAGGGRFITDVRGEARFTAPDDALIEARHPEHAIGRARIDLAAQVSRRVVIRLGARTGSILDEVVSGHVVGPDGAAVADALVVATAHTDGPATALASLLPNLETMSDAEGRFTLTGLDAERYDVVATHEGYAPAAATVVSGTIDLTLELAKGARLRGRVTDSGTGAAVVAFTVVVDARRGPIERDAFARVTVFDAEGRYEIDGLAPGSYVVEAVALGYAPAERAPVIMPDPPADIGPEDFALGRGGRMTGVVREEGTHAPLEGARVSVEGYLGSAPGAAPLLATTTTDAAGRFELSGLAAGLRSVAVVAADHHGRIVSGLPVAEGGDVGPITIELARTKAGEEPHLELTGIGAVLAAKDDGLLIGEVLPGGGAAGAGLVGGDAILAVDGDTITSLGFEAAIQRIRGPEGSTVRLLVRKGAGGEVVEVVVTRKRVTK